MPRCPSCGEYVVAAQASEFIDTGEIRHHWACDDCGQAFTTTVTLD
jgi:transcriptional regulator NrdR family protein